MANNDHSNTNQFKVDGLMNKYVLDMDNHDALHTNIEFTVRAWCEQHQISEELGWLAVQNYATARVKMRANNKL
tara:strand:+ start:74 stop:295 length:222 start_codon:yes stop_codon:yes gene_type:complete